MSLLKKSVACLALMVLLLSSNSSVYAGEGNPPPNGAVVGVAVVGAMIYVTGAIFVAAYPYWALYKINKNTAEANKIAQKTNAILETVANNTDRLLYTKLATNDKPHQAKAVEALAG